MDIRKVFDWLEPVLEKNGALARIEKIAPTHNGWRMVFTFRPVLKKVEKQTLLDVYYRLVVDSIVEAFEIREKDVSITEARRLGKRIRVEVPTEILEQALVTGTAWELRLKPGDLVSLTEVARSGGMLPGLSLLQAYRDEISWHRTTGIVIRGPARKNDDATFVVLSSTGVWDGGRIGLASRPHPGFRNYRRLCSAANFASNLKSMADAVMQCSDRVEAKLKQAARAKRSATVTL